MRIDIKGLITFPFKDSRWPLKLGIGFFLSAIPVVNFITSFFCLGYLMRILQGAVRKETRALPEWKSWGDLFLLGFGSVIIGFVFCIPLFLLSAMSLFALLKSSFAGTIVLSAVVTAGVGFGLLVPFTLAAFLEKEDFMATLKLRYIGNKVMMSLKDYIVFWVFALAILAGLRLLSNMIPYGGYLSIGISFYWLVVVMRGFGELYPYAIETPAPDVASGVQAVQEEGGV